MRRKATIPLVLMTCLWGTAVPAVTLNSRTSAITYATPDGVQHVWVFATSPTNLYAASSDDNWTWMDLGQPSFWARDFRSECDHLSRPVCGAGVCRLRNYGR